MAKRKRLPFSVHKRGRLNSAGIDVWQLIRNLRAIARDEGRKPADRAEAGERANELQRSIARAKRAPVEKIGRPRRTIA